MNSIPQTFDLAIKHHQGGNLPEAERLYRQILDANSSHAGAKHFLGVVALCTGRAQFAVECIREAVRLDPNQHDIFYNLGIALQAHGDVNGAVASFRLALERRPNNAACLNNLGNALAKLGRLDEAIADFREALRLQPGASAVLNNLGAALKDQGKLEEAKTTLREALRVQPAFLEALNNLGLVFQEELMLAEAAAYFNQALRLKPDSGEVHFNLAYIWLMQGQFERGWAEFEWRFRRPETPARNLGRPVWNGEPLNGRTILLHFEQGLGDTIQFIRFAPLVKRSGGTVIVECQPSLVPLLERCAGVDRVVASGSTLPPFDVSAALMSLPFLLRTTLDTVPAVIPYLRVSADREEFWRKRLADLGGLKAGIVWRGSPNHQGDRLRSMALSAFAPLARVPDVNLVSLQHGPGSEELSNWTERNAIVDLGTQFESFAETAAAMANLDLVISVDTAVVHCAGALGVPTWVLLRAAPDYRWMLGRRDSPWYPTVRLFRQARWGDWSGVINEVAAALRDKVDSKSQ